MLCNHQFDQTQPDPTRGSTQPMDNSESHQIGQPPRLESPRYLPTF